MEACWLAPLLLLAGLFMLAVDGQDDQNLIVWQLNQSFSINASTSPAFPQPQPNALIFPFYPEVQQISNSTAALNVTAFVFPCFLQSSPSTSATIFALCLTGVAPYQASSSSLDGFPAIIWRANWLTPAYGQKVSLTLQQDGDLVLRGDFGNGSTGVVAWRSNTSGMGVTRMELSQQPPNLILYDADNLTMWQSLYSPADTLAYGQQLQDGTNLVSYAVGVGNVLQAVYSLEINSTAQQLTLLFRKDAASQAIPYWIWQPNGSSSLNVSTGCGPQIAVINCLVKGPVFDAFITSEGFSVGDPSDGGNRSTVQGLNYAIEEQDLQTTVLKLGVDGSLSLLSIRKTWVVLADLFSGENACSLPQTCGDYGICYGATSNQCQCPNAAASNVSAFALLNSTDASQGCRAASPLPTCSNLTAGANASAQQVQMELLNGVDYFSSVPDAVETDYNISSGENCSALCLLNCTCLVAFWHADKHACFHIAEDQMGSFRGEVDSATFNTYLKVAILPSAPSPAASAHQGQSRKLAVGFGVAAAAFFVSCIFLYSLWQKRRNAKGFVSIEDSLMGDAAMSNLPPRYSYSELQAVTQNFSHLIGRGGFGSVYAGFLPNGTTKVAVKKLEGARQGEKEFKTELAIMAGIRHYHLLQLMGYCAEGADRRLLVYKYMENGSLDQWLFKSSTPADEAPEDGPVPRLAWPVRYAIAVGVAKGLAYLHDGCDMRIIHLDIKPQNILLDEGFVAKVADFGLSRGMEREESYVVTTMRGTPGYLAPEWMRDGTIDVKCDVFSFGMLLMEIVSGRKNLDMSRSEAPFYPEWAYSQLVSDRSLQSDGMLDRPLPMLSHSKSNCTSVENSFELLPSHSEVDDLTDAELESEIERLQLLRLITTAFLCVLERPEWRPSMSKVVEMLEGHLPLSHVDLPSIHEGLVFVFRSYNSLSSGSRGSSTVARALSAKFKEQLASIFSLSSSSSLPTSLSANECSELSAR